MGQIQSAINTGINAIAAGAVGAKQLAQQKKLKQIQSAKLANDIKKLGVKDQFARKNQLKNKIQNIQNAETMSKLSKQSDDIILKTGEYMKDLIGEYKSIKQSGRFNHDLLPFNYDKAEVANERLKIINSSQKAQQLMVAGRKLELGANARTQLIELNKDNPEIVKLLKEGNDGK